MQCSTDLYTVVHNMCNMQSEGPVTSLFYVGHFRFFGLWFDIKTAYLKQLIN